MTFDDLSHLCASYVVLCPLILLMRFKVYKLVIIAYIVCVWSFVEFGGQTSKNVHDVRMMFLDMT